MATNDNMLHQFDRPVERRAGGGMTPGQARALRNFVVIASVIAHEYEELLRRHDERDPAARLNLTTYETALARLRGEVSGGG